MLPHVHQQVLIEPNVLLVGLTMYFVLSHVHQQLLMEPDVSVLFVILQFA